MTSIHSMRRAAHAVAALTVALMLAGCRHASDLLNDRPSTRTVLELRRAALSGDTAQLTLTLDGGAVSSLGSLTARVTQTAGWRFVDCQAAQGAPLLACEPHEADIGVASAWVAGTTRGALLRLRFVRQQPGAAEGWQLAVQQVSSVAGASLLDSLDVRPSVLQPEGR